MRLFAFTRLWSTIFYIMKRRWLKQSGSQLGVTELEEISEDSGRVSFLLSDVDRNWWEVASPLSELLAIYLSNQVRLNPPPSHS